MEVFPHLLELCVIASTHVITVLLVGQHLHGRDTTRNQSIQSATTECLDWQANLPPTTKSMARQPTRIEENVSCRNMSVAEPSRNWEKLEMYIGLLLLVQRKSWLISLCSLLWPPSLKRPFGSLMFFSKKLTFRQVTLHCILKEFLLLEGKATTVLQFKDKLHFTSLAAKHGEPLDQYRRGRTEGTDRATYIFTDFQS